MATFLEYSQKLKKEIKNDLDVVRNIKLCFLDRINPFQKGTEHEIYRVGKTKSGTFLVLRKKKYTFDLENDIERLEIYCRNAESLANSRSKNLFSWRSNSPSFCIGVIYQSKYVGIITEDMSEGGKYQMVNSMGSISSERILNGEVIDEVSVDLDSCHVDYLRPEEIIRDSSYFDPRYVLVI